MAAGFAIPLGSLHAVAAEREVCVNIWPWLKRNRIARGIGSRFGRIANYAQMRYLRHRALHCRDDRRRLDAAHRLGQLPILRQIALQAESKAVRAAATDSIDHPAFLTAIALNTYDLEQGRAVVTRIPHTLLLRRIARSARQDDIRLLAAEKLGDAKMLKHIARHTEDPVLRLKTARYLNDPELLAELALQKADGERSATMRHEAHAALLNYLDQLARQHNTSALLSFLWAQPHLPFKIHAFLRLPGDHILKSVLQHLARQKYSLVPPEMIQKVFSKIETAGWRLSTNLEMLPCLHCTGQVMFLKTISSTPTNYVPNRMACAHCDGHGETEICKVTCIGNGNHRVVFTLPSSASL